MTNQDFTSEGNEGVTVLVYSCISKMEIIGISIGFNVLEE